MFIFFSFIKEICLQGLIRCFHFVANAVIFLVFSLLFLTAISFHLYREPIFYRKDMVTKGGNE